jgi:hypothetical protein
MPWNGKKRRGRFAASMAKGIKKSTHPTGAQEWVLAAADQQPWRRSGISDRPCSLCSREGPEVKTPYPFLSALQSYILLRNRSYTVFE